MPYCGPSSASTTGSSGGCARRASSPDRPVTCDRRSDGPSDRAGGTADEDDMDFDFTPEQVAFADEVERFLDANDDPDVFDLTRENMAQIVDTPKRREFMAKLGDKGWLGITWPIEYGGADGDGVYEYLLNERL